MKEVLTFNMIYYRNSAVVTWISESDSKVRVATFDYVNNKILYKYNMELKPSKVMVSAAAKGHSFFALIQSYHLYIFGTQMNQKNEKV